MGWYFEQVKLYNRLTRLSKPKWMLDIVEKFKAIRNSRRRHQEKLKKRRNFTEV